MEKNIYIENHEEISKITWNGKPVTVEVQLQIFELNHGLKCDLDARARYIAKYRPNDISLDDFNRLSEKEQDELEKARDAFKKEHGLI